MKFGRLIWGIIILLIGVAFLGINFGWWDNSIWNSIFDLWPLILVIIGISIIFGENNHVGLLLLLIIAIAGILYVSDYKNVRKRIGIEKNESLVSQNFSTDLPMATKNAQVAINFGAGNITINSNREANKLYTGSFLSPFNLKTTASQSDDIYKVSFSENTPNFNFFNSRNRHEFVLNLNESINYELKIDSGASKLNLNLGSLKINKIDLNTGASAGEIKIGKNVERVDVSIGTGASKTAIFIPRDYAISVESDSALVSNNYDKIGLKKDGKIWKSENFSTNTKQVIIKISAGASTINIEQY
jgi:hypothetical protein